MFTWGRFSVGAGRGDMVPSHRSSTYTELLADLLRFAVAAVRFALSLVAFSDDSQLRVGGCVDVDVEKTGNARSPGAHEIFHLACTLWCTIKVRVLHRRSVDQPAWWTGPRTKRSDYDLSLSSPDEQDTGKHKASRLERKRRKICATGKDANELLQVDMAERDSDRGTERGKEGPEVTGTDTEVKGRRENAVQRDVFLEIATPLYRILSDSFLFFYIFLLSFLLFTGFPPTTKTTSSQLRSRTVFSLLLLLQFTL